MTTKTQTPIAVLRRLVEAADERGEVMPVEITDLADARTALEDVEALAKAARAIAALFINRRGGCWDVVTIRENSDHHHNLRAAVAKFQVKS